jgi:GWxTD domain-containing protein
MMKPIVFSIIICTSISFAQFGEEMPRQGIRSLSPVNFEAIPFLTNDTTFIELVIPYRINPSFLFFAKTKDLQQEAYEAKGELVVEILNDKDASIARDFRPIQLLRSSIPTESTQPIEEIQGAFIFKLEKGIYKITLEAKDNESDKSFIDRNIKVDAQTFSPSGLNVSPAIFVEPILSESSSNKQKNFYPMNRGGNIIIGQAGGCLLQVTSLDTMTDIHLSWEVISKSESDEDIRQEFHGEKCDQENGTPVVTENQKRVLFSIRMDSKRNRTFYIPFPMERLETGTYQMKISLTQGTLLSTKDFLFNVLWPQKPHSLSDFKLAVDALRHIATEAELDSMTAFSSSASRKAFRAFWHRHNPDTTRAFNTAMAEYYRRVDEAINRFSSSNETDGYRTDRGRIYILFGSPSFMNRLLKPNSVPSEIWTYEKLKRRFFFTDQRKIGNYILVKMENY